MCHEQVKDCEINERKVWSWKYLNFESTVRFSCVVFGTEYKTIVIE